MGDEITYAHTAQTLARTGHVTYIGFINAIGGWQLYWGAAAIRFFGSSYLVLRWSMAVVAMAVAFLLHRCMERAGVRADGWRWRGTLTFCLSPLFLSKATTFLTDVPGVLAVVVCLYGCLRALEAGSVRSSDLLAGRGDDRELDPGKLAADSVAGRDRDGALCAVAAAGPPGCALPARGCAL